MALTRSALAARKALLDDVRYRVELDLTAREGGALSRTEIRFACPEPGAGTFVDLDVARPARIALNGTEVPATSCRDGRLELPGLDADNVLTVEAEVDHATDRRGLCSFEDGDHRFVYTKGSPEAAHRFMCCFMSAGVATFDLHVVAPAGWSVVSHTAPAEQPPPGLPGTWRFTPRAPMSPGVLTFAAGPWECNERPDTPGPRLYARPSVLDVLRSSPVADLLGQVLDLYERVLGVAHPFDQRDGVFIPGYGGQASSRGGLWTFHERVLHGSVDATWRRYVLWVIAHEAAHAWFGSLVGEQGPEDRCFTEGMATYLCHRAMDELVPDLHPWATFHLLEEAEAHDADTGPDAHAAAELPGDTTRTPAPSLVYAKPAAAARQLEMLIGTRAIDEGFTRFLRRHAFAEATTDDLVRSWEATAGVDLTEWAADWLKTSGVNTLELQLTTSADGTVESCQVVQSASPDGRLRTHRIGVLAYDDSPPGLVARAPIDVTVAGLTTPLPDLVGAPRPDLVVLNAPARSYVKVRLDERSRQTLERCLRDLDADTCAVCWVAAWEMVKDGLVPAAELRGWVDAYGDAEPDPQVRQLLIDL